MHFYEIAQSQTYISQSQLFFLGDEMNPLSPKQILRNLENGFFMTHQEQTEAAQLIRQLQESNRAMSESLIMYVEELAALRRDLTEITKGLK